MKIFGIGLSRTGTTSLNTALSILGFRAAHCPLEAFRIHNNEALANFGFINRYDALTDLPASALYRELASNYPDSKFILTIRDPEKWLRSCETHFLRGDGRLLKESLTSLNGKNYVNTSVHMLRVFKRTFFQGKLNQRRMFLRKKFYGGIEFDRNRFGEAYGRHLEEVRCFFKGQPERLLTLDICRGEGWEKICPFVEKEIPAVSFPRTNLSRDKDREKAKMKNYRDDPKGNIIRRQSAVSKAYIFPEK